MKKVNWCKATFCMILLLNILLTFKTCEDIKQEEKKPTYSERPYYEDTTFQHRLENT